MQKSLKNNLIYEGQWWLTNREDDKIDGKLTIIQNNQILLELKGEFKKNPANKIDDIFYPEIILGLAQREITLFKCIRVSEIIGIIEGKNKPGIKTIYNCYQAFVGSHFEKKDVIKFKELEIGYSHLDEWFDIKSLNPRVVNGKFKIEGDLSYDIKIKLNGNIKISFCLFWDFINGDFFSNEDIIIKKNTCIQIKFIESKTLDECNYFIKQIRNFLSIAMLTAVYPIGITGKKEKNDKYYFPITIYNTSYNIPTEFEKLSYHKIAFSLKDVEQEISVYLNNLFNKSELLKDICDIFFGYFHNKYMYVEQKFLTLTRLIESYHIKSENFDNFFEAPQVYKKNKNKVLTLIEKDDEKLHEWIKSIFEIYGNNKTFKIRLIDITNFVKDIFPQLSFKPFNEKFTDMVKDARNMLTHPEHSNKKGIGYEKYILQLTKRLEIILLALILLELGFSSKKVINIFENKLIFDGNWDMNAYK